MIGGINLDYANKDLMKLNVTMNYKYNNGLGEILTVFAIKQHCKQNDHAFDNQLIIG